MKFLVEKGLDDTKEMIREYIEARDKQQEIEFEFCTRNMTCIECPLFNHCVTAGLAPGGIRK